MKPALDELLARCSGMEPALVREHWARLDDSYFDTFGLDEIHAHIERLVRLSRSSPVELLFGVGPDGETECTVLAFDYPAEFSLITGILAALGFNILSGDVFTYARAALPSGGGRSRGMSEWRRRRAADQVLLRRKRIIDRFRGHIRGRLDAVSWQSEVGQRLSEIFALLEQGDAESMGHARHRVNEMVAARLAEIHADDLPVLYPVDLTVDNQTGPYTTLRVVSQDTPAFLYALSTALSLRGVSIEHVQIRTRGGKIEDEVGVLDQQGNKLLDEKQINQVKLSVLLTKQFTYFLARAPDPYAALCRFEQLVGDVLSRPERGQWVELLSSPQALKDLARLFGASDFIWEDMIRLQYEVLLPMLQSEVSGRRFARPVAVLRAELRSNLEQAADLDAKCRVLNEFKDREIFLIDLDHILNPREPARSLAIPLTRLAELVVHSAAEIVYADLAARHGVPRTVGGLEARFALFGLGKVGGEALGYASDIELLFVYSDSGTTDGAEPLSNAEFFDRLVRETARFILAKREGIFHIDLRLRPYGKSGPSACSLESFCRYYGPGGPALSYERLALVRLRAVGGDPALGAQVERLRDEFVYAARSIDIRELRELRAKQLEEKVKGQRYNAKFSPGALVDLEYDVQILQVMHGKDYPRLRTPRIHEALAALFEAGVMAEDESRCLVTAYYFLRGLINGLRMLRGSARDLDLPPLDSDEFAHLARRMGYERGGELEPEVRLHLDFETQTAVVRAFVEKHFGRDQLPGSSVGNVADLVLSEQVPRDLRDAVLAKAGFRNIERAYTNLRNLAGDATRRDVFARLAVLACDTLAHMPDSDMALNNWERFVTVLESPESHYEKLLSQPRQLEILLGILAGSQFLSDTLARNPEFLDWATDPANLHGMRPREDLARELDACARGAAGHSDWLNAMRRLRRREILRIGTRDICLHAPLEEIVQDLSVLAECITEQVLRGIWRDLGRTSSGGVTEAEAAFCVLAFGKLGGGELNYSSDIDLLGIHDDDAAGRSASVEGLPSLLESVMERLDRELSAHTEEGYAYRVDLRLRPYGRGGQKVPGIRYLLEYYRDQAALWEIQALLKLRPVAGNFDVGRRFLEQVRPVFLVRRDPAQIVDSIEQMRAKALHVRAAKMLTHTDVKSGLGGIRDVEFLVQGLQLIHAPDQPELIHGNTLKALEQLAGQGIVDPATAHSLRSDYVLLRRIEHFLQIMEDRQIHSLPREHAELEALARRVLGVDATAEDFLHEIDACQKRIRHAYETVLLVRATQG